MDSVRDGSEHLQAVHHYAALADGNHHHHQLQGPHYVVRDGGHFVIREDMQPYAVRDAELQPQQVLMAATLSGGMGSHDQAVNKLELRWTEQGFCDARCDSASAQHQQIVKEAAARWEQPMYEERDSVAVMEGAHHVIEGSHHVVMQPNQGATARWEDPPLCDGNDEDESRNESDQLDSKRTREVRWTEQALCDALAAVKSGSVTAYKASKDYGIPRSTLRNWLNGRNRSRKRGPRVDEALSFCRQELGGGDGDSGNLMGNEAAPVISGEEGNGSDGKDDSSWKKRKRAWTKQTLFEALNAVKMGDMPANKAAEAYGIPNSTLDYWMKGSAHDRKNSTSGYTGNSFGGREDPFSMGLDVNEDEEEEDEDEEEDDEEDDQAPEKKHERLKKKAREHQQNKKKVGGWSEKALTEAMEAIKNNTLTICKASRAYGIPRTTLRNWITGRTRSRKRGPHTGLLFEQVAEGSIGEGIGEDFSFSEAREELNTGREDNGEGDQLEPAEMSVPGAKRRGKGGKWSEQALLDAVEAVRSGSCEASGEAAHQYGMPASAAFKNRTKEHSEGNHDEDDSALPYESAGEVKEAEERTKKSNGWTEQALVNAIAAIKSGISIRKAGQSYGIPRTTLRNWLNGRTHSRKRGPHGGMSRGEQESAIVEWFFSMQQVCQSLMTLNALRRRAATLSVNKGSPFKDGIPVKKWWIWFSRRHADIAARIGDGLYETQNRNLLDEMSVVHMVTGEHLQILKRSTDHDDDRLVELALVPRGDENETSSQDDHEDQQQQQQIQHLQI